jgi:hypothetical protein
MMYALKRWLYRGNQPGWIAHLLNKAWEAFHSSGLGPRHWVTLEVVGRKSGKIISLPVVAAIVGEQRYLVSMLGDEAKWVQNVRAAHGKAFIRSGGRTEVRLEEVAVEQRAPVLKDYLRRAPGARPHIPVSKDAPIKEFEAIAASYPVFRIIPYQG